MYYEHGHRTFFWETLRMGQVFSVSEVCMARAGKTALALLLVCSAALATAQTMASVKGSVANVRSGPGTQHAQQWELTQGFPLKVLERRGRWVRVKDFENDIGWIAASLTHAVPHHIVKSQVANVRRGPGAGHARLAQLKYGDVVRTLEKRAGWVRVRHDQTEGWVSQNLLWGW
jgi:SH3-like domain-containing protein